MNSISEQILQAVDIITDNKLAKLNYDKTIQATIYSIDNLDTGEYKVKYEGSIFKVYSNDLSKTYKLKEQVYVSIPQGNFSDKKLIVSSVNQQSLSYNQLNSLKNAVFEISPTFDQLYAVNDKPLYDADKSYGVIAGITAGYTGSFAYIYQGPQNYSTAQPHGLFQQYANNYEYIRIQASFLTQFHSDHTKGNYGLEVEFYAKEGNIVSYKLDLPQFVGDPFGYSVYSQQWAIIKVQKNYLLGLKSVKLFEEDFSYDRIVENGLVTDKYNRTEPNIFVKDISIQYVDVKDLTETSYYLMIAVPQGICFSNNVSSLDLVGKLVYKGENIIDNNCECIWFERNLDIMPGVDGYNKDAGFGWKKIDSNGKTLSLKVADVSCQQDYKLLVVYNNDVKLTAEVTIYNLRSSYKFHIQQNTEFDKINLEVVNDNGTEKLKANWYTLYPDGSYQLKIKNQNPTDITALLKYSSIVFYCGIYSQSGTYLGTLTHTIMNSESEEDLSATYIGEDTFRYDANGDITIEDSEKERLLEVKLVWKEGYGTNYSISWFMRNATDGETILTGNRINPNNSMIDEIWVDNYNILHYNIKQKYQINLNNNSVFVKVKIVSGEEYIFEKEILFTKDGDQGTNGTTYIITVRPCNEGKQKLSGFYPKLIKDGTSWRVYDMYGLRCYVYKDGQLINDNNKFTITYRWSHKNYPFSIDSNDSSIIKPNTRVPSGSDTNSAEYQSYVKVQVTIKEKTSDRSVEVYALYPIDILITSTIPPKDYYDLSALPQYIKYTSSGITPQYYNNDISFTYNKQKYTTITSLNQKLLTIETKNNLKYINPTSSFIFENQKENSDSNIAVLKCTRGSDVIYHSIVMYLDTFGNEAINGWDGTKLDIDEKNGQYIFAPQVGAGEKNGNNQFTGVVMGKDSGQEKIGLYGYQNGVSTFGLMQDGKAYFGAKAGGGQIVVDGRHALILGGDVSVYENTGVIMPGANGMYLRLADNSNTGNDGTSANDSTKAIGIGRIALKKINPLTDSDKVNEDDWGFKEDDEYTVEEEFYVTYDGNLTANNTTLRGTIYATEGYLGMEGGWGNSVQGKNRVTGWHITGNRIESIPLWGNNSSYVALDSTPFTANKVDHPDSWAAIWCGKKSPGTNYKSTYIDGTTGKYVYPNPSSPAPFVVSKDGFLYATNAKIKGHIEADRLTANVEGSIANWTIEKNRLYIGEGSRHVELRSVSGGNYYCIWAGAEEGSNAPFSISNEGYIRSTSGTIGGWNITKNRLYSDNGGTGLSIAGTYRIWANATSVSSSGTPSFNESENEDNHYFWVKSNGEMSCRNAVIRGKIYAKEGNIGGWTIKEDRLSNSNNSIYISATSGIKMGDNFRVTSGGGLTCSSADVSGTIKCDDLRLDGRSILSDNKREINGKYIGSGIDAGNITEGTVSLSRLDADEIVTNGISAVKATIGEIAADTVTLSTLGIAGADQFFKIASDFGSGVNIHGNVSAETIYASVVMNAPDFVTSGEKVSLNSLWSTVDGFGDRIESLEDAIRDLQNRPSGGGGGF